MPHDFDPESKMKAPENSTPTVKESWVNNGFGRSSIIVEKCCQQKVPIYETQSKGKIKYVCEEHNGIRSSMLESFVANDDPNYQHYLEDEASDVIIKAKRPISFRKAMKK